MLVAFVFTVAKNGHEIINVQKLFSCTFYRRAPSPASGAAIAESTATGTVLPTRRVPDQAQIVDPCVIGLRADTPVRLDPVDPLAELHGSTRFTIVSP